MVLDLWWPSWGEPALLCGGALLVWALSLYVVSRGGWQRIPLLAMLAMWSLVVYQLGGGLAALAADPAVQRATLRATWAGPALLPGLWFALTAALASDEVPEDWPARRRRPLAVGAAVAVICGLAFAVGGLTDLVRQWNPPLLLGEPTCWTCSLDSRPGPLYPYYVAYILVCAVAAAGTLLVLWRSSARGSPMRARFWWLLMTALLFVAGGAYLAYAASSARWTGVPGHLALLSGMVIMGWSIARYGALLTGEVVAGDFSAYCLSVGAIMAVYGVALLAMEPLAHSWLARAIPLVMLAVATHVMVERRGAAVDRLLLGPVTGALRGRLRALANRVARQPDTLSALVDVRESVAALVREATAPGEKLAPAFGSAAQPSGSRASGESAADATAAPVSRARIAGASANGAGATPRQAPMVQRLLVEGALRHLNDLPALTQDPLTGVVAPSAEVGMSALEKASLLRTHLDEAIGRLRPGSARPTPGSSVGPGGWLHYLVLHEAYVEGRPNKQIMHRYGLSEGTFHRARRRAIDAVALDLYEHTCESWAVLNSVESNGQSRVARTAMAGQPS